MNKYWKHFKTICKHKWVVFKLCVACGITWRGIVHDISKFGLTEFIASAKHFQGDRSPIEAEKEEQGYSIAWNHHKGHNPHHWEYWTDFGKNGEVIAQKIPYKYVVEMVCDWIGAGMVYSSGNWSQSDPLEYYRKVREGRHFHPKTEELITAFLLGINDRGLESFYKMAKGMENPYLFVDYEDIYCP